MKMPSTPPLKVSATDPDAPGAPMRQPKFAMRKPEDKPEDKPDGKRKRKRQNFPDLSLVPEDVWTPYDKGPNDPEEPEGPKDYIPMAEWREM